MKKIYLILLLSLFAFSGKAQIQRIIGDSTAIGVKPGAKINLQGKVYTTQPVKGVAAVNGDELTIKSQLIDSLKLLYTKTQIDSILNAVVHKTGDEIIFNTKTFSDGTSSTNDVNYSGSYISSPTGSGVFQNAYMSVNYSGKYIQADAIGGSFNINSQGITGRTGTLKSDSLTSNRTFEYPDASGTLALKGQIPTNNNQLTNGSGYLTSESDPVFTAQKGAASGVATLDGSSKIPISQIPDALVGSVNYQGNYNAATNTPTLPSASGNKGFYYVVSVAGTQAGLTLNPGDWIISNGTSWEKVDNNNSVTSVAGKVGAVTLNESDISGLTTDLAGKANTSGSNATGTWGINITGNAATATGPNDASEFQAALGLGTGNSPTFTGLNLSGEIANTIASFDASKNVRSLSTSTYPSLTELSYVKGLTSAVQTQLGNKESILTFTSPLSRATNTISIPAATTSVNGYLSSTDWNTFNNKQNALGYTPYNPASYPVNSGGETLQSVTGRGASTTNSVGVYTSFLDSRFQVGNGSDGASLRVGYSGANEWYLDGSAFHFRASNNSTQLVNLYESGNLNLGYTSDQGYKLAVNGPGYFAGNLTSTNLSGTNTGDQTITLSGDVSGSGTGAITTTLSNTGVSAGTYTNATVTVDSKGRITSAISGSTGSSTSGRYTPTVLSSSNVYSSSISSAHYIQVGNEVTVSGIVNIQPSTTGVVDIELEFPVSSSLINGASDLVGSGNYRKDGLSSPNGVVMVQIGSNNRASLFFNAPSADGFTIHYSYTYEVNAY